MKTVDPLHERAAEIIRAYADRESIRSRVKKFDAERDAKLAGLTNQITELEHHLDPENIADVQRLVTLREQKTLTERKLAQDREVLIAAVDKEVAQSVAGLDLQKFFQSAVVAERAKAVTVLLPFFENEARANGAAGQCDSVNAMARWPALLNQIPTEIVVQRLATFVSGEKPLWKI